MRYHILCGLIFLIVICSVSLYIQTEGFADFCFSIPDILTVSSVFILVITVPFAIIAFYAWNWEALKTTTVSHILRHYFLNSKLSS